MLHFQILWKSPLRGSTINRFMRFNNVQNQCVQQFLTTNFAKSVHFKRRASSNEFDWLSSLSTLLFLCVRNVKHLHVTVVLTPCISQEDEVSKYYFQKQLRRVWLMMCFGVWFRRFYWGFRETGTHAVSFTLFKL